jgi:hypothetical protein
MPFFCKKSFFRIYFCLSLTINTSSLKKLHSPYPLSPLPPITVISNVPTFLVNSSYIQTSSHSGFSGAHICKPFKESRNRFPAWRDESIPGIHKRLQIRAQMSLFLVQSSFQFARLSISPSHFELSQTVSAAAANRRLPPPPPVAFAVDSFRCWLMSRTVDSPRCHCLLVLILMNSFRCPRMMNSFRCLSNNEQLSLPLE